MQQYWENTEDQHNKHIVRSPFYLMIKLQRCFSIPPLCFLIPQLTEILRKRHLQEANQRETTERFCSVG